MLHLTEATKYLKKIILQMKDSLRTRIETKITRIYAQA